MAFKIQLYKTFVKRINSTKQPTGTYIEKDVNLKRDTSIMSPTFILSTYDPAYNYVYVPSWGRYYFVNDVVLGNTNLFELHCTFDALASYKASIGSYTCFVERTSDATKYDLSLYDNAITSSEDITYSTQASTTLWGAGGVIVCRVMNIATGITTYVGSMASFAGLFTPISDDPDILDTIEAVLKYYLCNPGDYVIDTYFLGVPFSVLNDSGKLTIDTITSGWYTNGGAYRWNTDSPILTSEVTLNKPTAKYSDFRKSSGAFSQYYIYIPSVGEVPLSADFIDSTLSLKWVVDVFTGETSFNLYATASTKTLIATYHGNVKAPLMTGSMMPNGGALATSIASGAALALTGPVGIGAATLNVVQNIISATPSINGSQGSCAGLLMEPSIIVSCVAKNSADAPVTVGKPCCKNLLLGGVSGYIKTAGASIDNIAGTDADKEILNSAMDNGFYYE